MSNHVLINPNPFFRFSTNIPSELTLAKDMKYQSFSNPYLDHYCISKCSEKKETNKIYEESCKTSLTRQTSLLVVFFFCNCPRNYCQSYKVRVCTTENARFVRLAEKLEI